MRGGLQKNPIPRRCSAAAERSGAPRGADGRGELVQNALGGLKRVMSNFSHFYPAFLTAPIACKPLKVPTSRLLGRVTPARPASPKASHTGAPGPQPSGGLSCIITRPPVERVCSYSTPDSALGEKSPSMCPDDPGAASLDMGSQFTKQLSRCSIGIFLCLLMNAFFFGDWDWTVPNPIVG